ncbi:hypothetical protein E4U19_005806 [Claviceps sp. Clav32 group G5]|nr:hypothetical protein E4U19_005806 [Claviceps sp. Clav32 group G5]KAG6050884.1 hypothetical protein E4U39_002832 [Claviceps sp. Clav50 group G5]
MRGFANAARTAPRVRASLTKSHPRCRAMITTTTPALKIHQQHGHSVDNITDRTADTTATKPVPVSASAAPTGAPILKKTPLYDLHIAHGAKMVPFAAHSMPIQYPSASITDSHHFTRQHASLFDVSHMVPHFFRGPQAASFLEKVTPSAWTNQPLMQSKLTTFLWPHSGGIVDDAMITRTGEEEFYVVTNGACLEKDTAYLKKELEGFGSSGKEGGVVEWSMPRGSALLALQGPQAQEILGEMVVEGGVKLEELFFASAAYMEVRISAAEGREGGEGGEGVGLTERVLVTRGGYTGEDGFEIFFDGDTCAAAEAAAKFAEMLLKVAGPERLQLAGLGARDSLRLEAGMCLYGHDLDDATTPVEAGLNWVIDKSRRHETAGFHGAEKIAWQMVPKNKGGAGVERRRVGFFVEGAPAREGADVQFEGESVGKITSGIPSPTLGKNIAMGYVRDGLHKPGTELDVVVRGRLRKAAVARMPFYAPRYYRKV